MNGNLLNRSLEQNLRLTTQVRLLSLYGRQQKHQTYQRLVS